jgi:type II secretory pathway component GspD/PulD (secretin)
VDGPEQFDERISLDTLDASLQDVLKMFADILHVDLEMDPTMDQKIRLTFENITVRTGLNAVCESGGCKWELADDDTVLRITYDETQWKSVPDDPRLERIYGSEESSSNDLDTPISLQLDDAPAPEVFKLIAKVLDAKLLLDMDFGDEKITVHMEEASYEQVLRHICKDIDCAWILSEDTLQVYRPR